MVNKKKKRRYINRGNINIEKYDKNNSTKSHKLGYANSRNKEKKAQGIHIKHKGRFKGINISTVAF